MALWASLWVPSGDSGPVPPSEPSCMVAAALRAPLPVAWVEAHRWHGQSGGEGANYMRTNPAGRITQDHTGLRITGSV